MLAGAEREYFAPPLAAHARVSDGKAAAREMGRLLSFQVERDRFMEVPFLAIGGGQSRIQIKIIWIKLERPLALDNCIVDAVVSQVGGGGNVTGDGRYRIQFLSFEDKPESVLRSPRKRGSSAEKK